METIHQVYEHAPAAMPIPLELRDRPLEITIKPLGAPANFDGAPESTLADPHIAQFFGCLPDFPEREPQGEYEVRGELT